MGGPSEREYKEKLIRIRERLNKRAINIRKDFTKIEKMKVEALKTAEDAKRSAARDLDKIDGKIAKSRDLAPESKERLRSEVHALRNTIGEEYAELKMQISRALVPA